MVADVCSSTSWFGQQDAEPIPHPAECPYPLPWIPLPINHTECWSLLLSTLQVPIDNHIPEKTGSQVPTEPKELEENEVFPKRSSAFDGDEDVSNKVSMSSTAQGGNIVERTEVLAGKVPGFPQDTSKGERAWAGIVLQARMPLAQWSLTFLAPGTSFMEESFSTNGMGKG